MYVIPIDSYSSYFNTVSAKMVDLTPKWPGFSKDWRVCTVWLSHHILTRLEKGILKKRHYGLDEKSGLDSQIEPGKCFVMWATRAIKNTQAGWGARPGLGEGGFLSLVKVLSW